MVEQPLLVAGDQIVADLGEHDRLAVGGEAADHEGRDDGAANQGDQVGAAVVEDLVDHVAHDPGAERHRRRDGQQAADRQQILRDIVAAVFGQHAPDHRNDLAGVPPAPF